MLDHTDLITQLPEPRMRIGADWVTQSETASFELVDPSTARPVAQVPMAGPGTVAAAVASAVTAAPGWRDWRPHKRRDVLYRLAELIISERDRFAVIAAVEQGLPGGAVYARFCAEWFKYYSGWTEKISGSVPQTYPADSLTYVLREPYGVVAIITPFNESLAALGMKVAPALAAGNAVVIKPPEQTPLQTVLFAELCAAAGLPPGVVNVITGGPAAGKALVTHRDVAKISFTGGINTARAILRTAADRAAPVVTELGGKSANLVFPDGDWQAGAALSALNACVNLAGQGCMFPTRLLVHRSIHAKVVEEIRCLLSDVQQGDPAVPGTQMGPVINASSADRIMAIIKRARDTSTLLVGGERQAGELADGYFIQPTVFDDVPPDSELAQTEVFGPVLAITAFEDEDEAVQLANNSRAGLAAYVFTDDLHRANRLARRLEAGTVGINGLPTVPPTLPFGGYKSSGAGREGGYEGISEFLQTKTVYVPVPVRDE